MNIRLRFEAAVIDRKEEWLIGYRSSSYLEETAEKTSEESTDDRQATDGRKHAAQEILHQRNNSDEKGAYAGKDQGEVAYCALCQQSRS